MKRDEQLTKRRRSIVRVYLSAACALTLLLGLTTDAQAQWTTNGNNINNTNTGSVGIGTTAPALPLDVNGSARIGQVVLAKGFAATGKGGYIFAGTGGAGPIDAEMGLFVANDGTGGGTSDGPYFMARGNNFTRISGQRGSMYFYAGNSFPSPAAGEGEISFGTNGTERLTLKYAGNVGIGTSNPSAKLDVNGNVNITGDITLTGNINAKYQDVAEWVPAAQPLPAATVVVLDPTKSNQVMASLQAYDLRVAGVVSEKPGLALGEAGKGKVLVATTGRVKVKVDATRAPVKVGDLLVTSDREGAAMKSEPLMIQGRLFHSPGTLIGKALEPLEKGVGEILVLLSLQ